MNTTAKIRDFDAAIASTLLHEVKPKDDKYSRGVVTLITGSERYPGAAVLGVDAAAHSGVGMVRYVGPRRSQDLVLVWRPEVVCAHGRADAWVIGSGISDLAEPDALSSEQETGFFAALSDTAPGVLDAGALGQWSQFSGRAILTPHQKELARLLAPLTSDWPLQSISEAPQEAALAAAQLTCCVVLLKGFETYVASPSNAEVLKVTSPTTRLATAGSGDVLAGLLGGLLASHSAREDGPGSALSNETLQLLAATASFIHVTAARRAMGPLVAGDLPAAIAATISEILSTP